MDVGSALPWPLMGIEVDGAAAYGSNILLSEAAVAVAEVEADAAAAGRVVAGANNSEERPLLLLLPPLIKSIDDCCCSV